jgi:long-chain acyl-CoA synthetase
MSAASSVNPQTAPQILFAAAQQRPDHVRFVSGERAVTLAELAQRVQACARWLRIQGVEPGDRVALFGANSLEWIVAALGVQTCGAAFVGVHAGSSAELAAHVISHSRSRLALVSESEAERVGPLPGRVLTLDWVAQLPPASAAEDRSRADDPACLIYTSGTTGKPKGVVLTHRNLATNGADWVSVCGPLLPEAPREVLWLPLSHVFGWGAACVGTAMGFTSTLVAPQDVVPALAQVAPHVFMTVPILLERLAAVAQGEALRELCGGELRLCLAGGASLSVRVKERFRAAEVPLLEGYGLTETSPTLTLERPGDDGPLDTVGTAYPSVELRLAADGEVLARGPSVFTGYYRDPEATRSAIDAEGWFHTGDLGAFDGQGRLRIVGRKKELLVLASGKKVAPAGIEARAAEDPWIERLVLYGTGRPVVVGLLVPDLEAVGRDLGRPFSAAEAASDPDVQAGLQGRIDRLNATLSSFERVRGVAVAPRPLTVEEGHLTPSFKVRRRVVWDAFAPLLADLYQPREVSV